MDSSMTHHETPPYWEEARVSGNTVIFTCATRYSSSIQTSNLFFFFISYRRMVYGF